MVGETFEIYVSEIAKKGWNGEFKDSTNFPKIQRLSKISKIRKKFKDFSKNSRNSKIIGHPDLPEGNPHFFHSFANNS